MREPTEEKKIGLSDTEEMGHTAEDRPCSAAHSDRLASSWEEIETNNFLPTENWRTASGLKESLTVGTSKEKAMPRPRAGFCSRQWAGDLNRSTGRYSHRARAGREAIVEKGRVCEPGSQSSPLAASPY